MIIKLKEQLSGEDLEIPSDLVVLLVGMEAREDADKWRRLVNISRDKDGWFIESHPKLDPVATTTDGIFIAGACSSPKDIPDSVAQARAAVARILAKISQGKIAVDAVYSEVEDELCSGCRICNGVPVWRDRIRCRKEEEPDQRGLQSVRCCVVACPSGAIKARHFTDDADLRPDRRGCWRAIGAIEAHHRRLPLQLVLVHRGRPGRHQPHPYPPTSA